MRRPMLLMCLLALVAGVLSVGIPLEFTTQPISVAELRDICTTPPKVPVVESTIDAIHEAFKSGRLTCLELVKTYIQRIKAYDKTTGMNAIRTVMPGVKKIARQMDKQLAKARARGTALPPLFCVPILAKDNMDVVGVATTNGAEALLDALPYQDATMIKQVKDAGAIILAKTNLAEWAFSNQKSLGSVFGTTRNPYDLNRVTTGSSGGTAAGVCASLGMIGFGTDTGNSIRGPSSAQGLVGIRSTIGATSRAGIAPLRLSRDIGGPIGRTVTDVAKVFSAIAGGYDPRDPSTTDPARPAALSAPKDYTTFLDAGALRGAKIAVNDESVYQTGADQKYIDIFYDTLNKLQAAGATIVYNFTIPGWKRRATGTETVLNFPGGTTTTATANGGFGNNIEYELGSNVWMSTSPCSASFKEDLDAWISGTQARLNTMEKIIDSGLYHPQSDRSLLSGVYGSSTNPNNYTKAEFPPSGDSRFTNVKCNGCVEIWQDECRLLMRDRMVKKMDELGVDVFVYTSWSNAPRLIGDDSSSSIDNSQSISPITGAPAMTVPIGYANYTGNGGNTASTIRLPVGLQMVARPFREDTLFKLGYAIEQLLQARIPPPAFPECGTSMLY